MERLVRTDQEMLGGRGANAFSRRRKDLAPSGEIDLIRPTVEIGVAVDDLNSPQARGGSYVHLLLADQHKLVASRIQTLDSWDRLWFWFWCWLHRCPDRRGGGGGFLRTPERRERERPDEQGRSALVESSHAQSLSER